MNNLLFVNANPTTASGSLYSSALCLRSNTLNFTVFNSRSVRNKRETIFDQVVHNNIGLCTITETWLNDGDSATIAQLSVAGYIFKNFPGQSLRHGGGTGILYRESLSVLLIDGKENKSYEFSEWIVKVLGRCLRLMIVYRPPYSSLHPISPSVFFDEFS